MNPPDINVPLGQTENEKEVFNRGLGVESSSSPEDDEASVDEVENFASLLQPTRWWMTSTAFPLLAGTFGPMANAFSICSLTQNWRYKTHRGGGMVDVGDPDWLIAVNAVSLTFALISNFSLLLNMARRLSFSVAQPITIVGWYLSSFLLIALVGVVSRKIDMPANSGLELTQAYYYAMIAAIIYFIISSLMVVTVYGAYKGHYSREFSLTTIQRTLMLQTISFMVYLLGGSAIFAHVEDWRYLDALYWADFTLLTIGIGDFAPATSVGRGLLFPYAFGGILVLGLVVGSIRSLMIERGEKNMIARITEKTRRSTVKKIRASEKKMALNPEHEDGTTNAERRRREHEFHIMRQVNQAAATKRRWFSLVIPGIAWLMLWFLGAVAFWKSEVENGWTYFDAIYFSYTSLLTIGYGDISPSNMWGKPFFVFWSLLAVPALTILISSMGDTLVKGVRDATNYVGELTILPGDYGFITRLRTGLCKLSNGSFPSQSGKTRNEEKSRTDEGSTECPPDTVEEYEQRKTRELHNALSKSVHHYNHLLMRELCNMQRQVRIDPSRKFEYGEWAYFLKLLGYDESCSNYHRRIFDSEADTTKDIGPSRAQSTSLDNHLGNWSWVGERSPLLGNKEESEWLLEALSQKLDWELHALSRNANRA